MQRRAEGTEVGAQAQAWAWAGLALPIRDDSWETWWCLGTPAMREQHPCQSNAGVVSANFGGFYPRPVGGGTLLRPYQQAPRRPRCSQVPALLTGAAGSRTGLGKGSGSTGGFCPTQSVPSCQQCRETRQGMANCCRYGHEGHPQIGAPRGRGQYASRLGMRKQAQPALWLWSFACCLTAVHNCSNASQHACWGG